MRSILLATGFGCTVSPLDDRHPAPLLPVLDRPLIQHIVEALVDHGVTGFDFLLSHLPRELESFLGSGARWGSTFRFHLVRDPARPYKLLPVIAGAAAGELMLIGHADRLPRFTGPPNFEGASPALFYCRAAGEAQWTGWGLLQPSMFAGAAGAVESSLETHLRRQADIGIVEVEDILDVRSFAAILASNTSALERACRDAAAPEVHDGVWISRNVSLHPAATLVPPVYLGQNVQVAAGVRVGPDAVIGHDCVLDRQSTVARSVVFAGSFVGEALELDHVLVDKNRLVNVKIGAAVSVTDDFILSGIRERRVVAALAGGLSRLLAMVLLLVLWPVLLLTALVLALFRSGPVLHKQEMVRLPAPADPLQWRTAELRSFTGRRSGCGIGDFLLRLLPSLAAVALGRIRFVGVAPRPQQEILALPHDWQALYLRAKAGLIDEASVQFGDKPTEDEIYSAEVIYSVKAGMRHDLRLLLGYAARIFGWRTSGSTAPVDKTAASAHQHA